jgi:hypothetical protein
LTTPALLEALIAEILHRHPFVYCYSCLATSLGAEEHEIRDTAQRILLQGRDRFGIAQRVCVGCGAADQLLVCINR